MKFRMHGSRWRRLIASAFTLLVVFAHPQAAAQSPADVSKPAASQRVSTPFPPRLLVGVLADGWPPLEVLDGDRLTGFSADYLRLLVGTDVELVPKRYPDMPRLIAAACAGEVDLLMSVARTPERERCLAFTTPYLNGAAAFVTRSDDADALTSPDRIARARIATEKGFALEQLLRKRFPQATIEPHATTWDALDSVATGSADVYAGFAAVVRYQLSAEAFRGLRIAYEERMVVRDMRFAVPASAKALRDRLNVALSGVRPAAATALRARWLDGAPRMPTSPLALSADERAWLRALPPLSVGFDDDWAPFSYVGPSGQPSGIASDYLDYLGHVLGVTFRRIPTPGWIETTGAFRHGDFALLATAMRGDARLPGAQFTQPYEHYPFALVARRNEPVVRGLKDFAGRRVVLTPHAPAAELFAKDLPGSQIVRAATLEEGLTMVADRRADVLIADAAAVAGPLRRDHDDELQIVGPAGHDDEVSFAVRGDLAPLAGLIDRALRAMPAGEAQRIRHRWVTAAVAGRSGWSVNALRLLPLLIVFGVVLLVTLRAYVLLQREMKRRRRAERVLARQVELQNTMMEMIPYPLAARDLQNRYLAVNHAYEEATGLSRVQLLGRSSTSVAPWGEANSRRVDGMYRQTVADGGARRVELVLDGHDGRADRDDEARHGIFATRLCSDSRNEPFCVLGTMIDITDIRRAELRARETERLLSDVTHSLPAIVFQLRRTPDGRYAFPYIGGDTQRLFGDGGSELIRANALDMQRVHPKDRKRLIVWLERSARRLTPVHVEFRYFASDGTLWLRAEFVPHRKDDDSVVWSGYAADVSVERARADELARARDIAQAASRAKDNFLAMMSHEIRTPMNGVLGLVEVLERTPLNVEQSEMVGMVQESAGALLQILDDLLDYAKIEVGRLAIESEPFDVRELVDRAVGLLAGRAHEKGLKLRVDVEPDVAAVLCGDSVRLRQILFNLLSNAIKFTPRGEVCVNVSATAIDGDGARQLVALSVEDTGIGIAPHMQAHLFEPFVQAESSTTRRFGGTGLGLAICRKLAELMGGTLTLRSESGRGTCMTLHIELPVEMPVGPADGLLGKHALVACDDERTARALTHFGTALGMRMTHVASSALFENEGADVQADHVDLIFMSDDVSAPSLPTDAPVIRVTASPKPTGYRVTDSGVLLSANPVSWCGLGTACAVALAGLPVAVSSSVSRHAEAGGSLAAPDHDKERLAGRLILVAEDHPVNQELIRHQLALLGFACDVVNDGEEALAELARNDYGCLITDCHMPKLSGYGLVRKLRERERESGAQRLPVLGITASTASDDLRLCLDAGMDDCLVKPMRLATLRDALARWFGVTEGGRHPMPASAPARAKTLAHAAGSGGDFEPLDLDHMIHVWGSEATVKALLDSFVSAVRDDLLALLPLLDDVNVARLREWHHRLAGAVGVLQYPALLSVLETYRWHMDDHSADQLREEGLQLIHTCEALLNDIEKQAAWLA
ncbi:hypothetical protein C7405_103145 [Paraburkholderia caballeronis]|nr:hypothetical protein C7405_103145 [Paraburkholderia caballeronis]